MIYGNKVPFDGAFPSGDIVIPEYRTGRSIMKSIDVDEAPGDRNYPAGAILHFDADADYENEAVGMGHDFNYSILSPQFQLQPDGSYSNVGAKPAVDTFDGERWVRSCGAYTNALPTGAAVIGGPQWFVGAGSSVGAAVDGWYPITTLLTTSRTLSCNYSGPASGFLYFGFRVKAKVNTTISVRKTIDSAENQTVNLTAGEETIVGLFEAWTATLGALSFFDASGQTGNTFDIRDPFVINLAYPVPYVPPGVTQPASNATGTNGMWFTLAEGSPAWQALTGEPLTLATRVLMGVLYNEVSTGNLSIIDPSGAVWLQRFGDSISPFPARAFDGTTSASAPLVTWPRNAIINRVTQVSADGTQFRVGYMIEGTHTAIQWSVWVAYDGSFDPPHSTASCSATTIRTRCGSTKSRCGRNK